MNVGDCHADAYIKIGGQGHTATANHSVGHKSLFADLLNGLNDLKAWKLNPGMYHCDTRNCVWGAIRIGNDCAVAMPTFDYQPPLWPAVNGFWHPDHLHTWLNAQP